MCIITCLLFFGKEKFKEKWHLDPSQYAEVGGAFPIRLVNCPTAIGTITCSGFDHTIDHGIIIDVLEKDKSLYK